MGEGRRNEVEEERKEKRRMQIKEEVKKDARRKGGGAREKYIVTRSLSSISCPLIFHH